MFTGIIQCKGKILQIPAAGPEARLRIQPRLPVTDYVKGESIAINGVCLTVEDFTSGSFAAYASAETLLRSNLGQLQNGSEVNLERALKMGDRIGGHLVSGHIDAVCVVEAARKAGSSHIYRFKCPPEQSLRIVSKGSVTVDGISLTVNGCGDDFFEVNAIPATLESTTMGQWTVGRLVNLETDLIGKYVERMLGEQNLSRQREPKKDLDMDFFSGNGFC